MANQSISSCQFVTPDHISAEVCRHGYGLLGQHVWLQRNVYKERKSPAWILTINFAALHLYRLSCGVDTVTFDYMLAQLFHLSSRKRDGICLYQGLWNVLFANNGTSSMGGF